MGYTRNEIVEKCRSEFCNINTFYQADIINYRGKCSDTDEPFTEVIADFICEHIQEYISGIPRITRNSPYKTAGHNGEYNPASNRVEEITAMRMFRFCADGGQYSNIGRIIDYQTPLKSVKTDEAGKIDLLAYDGEILRLLELKKTDSKESMLRCVLEGFTYLQTVDKGKLLRDYELPADTIVKACPFVFFGGEQWREMQENRPQLRRLMQLLDSKPYYITERDGIFEIKEE